MERRPLLRLTVGLVAVGLAGCIGGPTTPRNGGDGGDGTTGGRNDSNGGIETTFEVVESRCGNQVNRAAVSFDDGRVSVEGTTWGNDACYIARLESATVADGTLTVAVITESEADEDEACAQCITEIEYRAAVETPSRPAEVVVTHDGERVTTATT